MTLSPNPTPYPEVNAILQLLLSEIRGILGDRLVGIYLFGSLSQGDFDPASSDIDFLVVTEDALPEDTLVALEALHARIAASGLKWATKLEGAYIPRDALRRYDPANARHPSIGVDWPFGIAQHRANWIFERHIVREQGVVVWGPPPATLIDPVTPNHLRAATIDNLQSYWLGQLDGLDRLRRRAYQAFAILTLCRSLYTLAHGEIASKPAAAAWARETLEPPWPALIDRALAWRNDSRPDDESLHETLAFVRYTIARCLNGRADLPPTTEHPTGIEPGRGTARRSPAGSS